MTSNESGLNYLRRHTNRHNGCRDIFGYDSTGADNGPVGDMCAAENSSTGADPNIPTHCNGFTEPAIRDSLTCVTHVVCLCNDHSRCGNSCPITYRYSSQTIDHRERVERRMLSYRYVTSVRGNDRTIVYYRARTNHHSVRLAVARWASDVDHAPPNDSALSDPKLTRVLDPRRWMYETSPLNHQV
jgi:hypothetical protein